MSQIGNDNQSPSKNVEGEPDEVSRAKCRLAQQLSRIPTKNISQHDRDIQTLIAACEHPPSQSNLPANSGAIEQLHAIVDAWEALPGGGQVQNRDVEKWLSVKMSPAINAIRGFLRRPIPGGITPPLPEMRGGVTP